MPEIIEDRMSAQIEGDFVVFIIGMRINAWWKVHKWVPVAMAMQGMLRQLRAAPVEQTGCLGTRISTPGMTLQYWRSFDHLEAFARDTTGLHMTAWKKFNKAAKAARGDVGIWHETYLIPAGHYETLYSGMPRQGLGLAGTLVPATGPMNTARGRAAARNTTEDTQR